MAQTAPPITNTDALTAADRALLTALHEEDDPRALVEKLHDYYLDVDRADRTPRTLMYFHLMKLLGQQKRAW